MRELGDEQRGGTAMQRPVREDRGPPRHYEAARVEIQCRLIAGHARQLLLEHATIYAAGWACWSEAGHVIIGYVQAGRCCDLPEVHAL
jgi:hypothetical protein